MYVLAVSRLSHRFGLQTRWDGDGNVDFGAGDKPIADSPITRGFNEYFGVSASLDMAFSPFTQRNVWIENDRFVPAKLVQQAGISLPKLIWSCIHWLRAGGGPRADALVSGFAIEFEEGLDVLAGGLANAAKGDAHGRFRLKRMAEGDKPFFLYMPLRSPGRMEAGDTASANHISQIDFQSPMQNRPRAVRRFCYERG